MDLDHQLWNFMKSNWRLQSISIPPSDTYDLIDIDSKKSVVRYINIFCGVFISWGVKHESKNSRSSYYVNIKATVTIKNESFTTSTSLKLYSHPCSLTNGHL